MPPFYGCENWCSGKIYNLSKATNNKIRTQVSWFPCECIFHLSCLQTFLAVLGIKIGEEMIKLAKFEAYGQTPTFFIFSNRYSRGTIFVPHFLRSRVRKLGKHKNYVRSMKTFCDWSSLFPEKWRWREERKMS